MKKIEKDLWAVEIYNIKQNVALFVSLTQYPKERWVRLSENFPLNLRDGYAGVGTFEKCVRMARYIHELYGDAAVKIRLRHVETGQIIPLELL